MKKIRTSKLLPLLAPLGLLMAAQFSYGGGEKGDSASQQVLDRGRYLLTIGGCNDCHTPGFLLNNGSVDEQSWMIGDGSMGWTGPWGTTYGSNIRRLVHQMTEEQWIAFAGSFQARPPMGWFNLNKMASEDLSAIYHYLRHLGPSDHKVPDYLPPGQVPETPHVSFPSP